MNVARAMLIGNGTVVSGSGGFGGLLARADDVDSVLELLASDLSETVLLTDQASATAVAPLLPQLAGVICTQGGDSAHLAIVSRALGLPCLMGATFGGEAMHGMRVHVDAEGNVFLG